MDLPPRFRRHPRHGNVLQPPQFIHHHLTLPTPPPPPPTHPPHVLLPPPQPLLPRRHDGQFPVPSHFSLPPYLPVMERSYFHELYPPRRPYLERYHPPHQENLPYRIIHDYPQRDSILKDEIRGGCNNGYIYDFPRTWGRELTRGATEVSSRVSDIYSSSRVSRIEARDMWKDTNTGARRWDNGNRELHSEREDDVRNWECGINGGRELFFDRNIDARRWECVNSGGRDLSFDRDYDRNGLDCGVYDGISLQLENRQQEFLESNLDLHRFSGRLGRESSKIEFDRPKKMKRVQEKSALNRTRLGKARRRRIRGKKILSSSSMRGREKENFEYLETIAKDNQGIEQSSVDLSISFKSNSLVAKAILVPSSPVSKEEMCLSTRNQKIRKINRMSDMGSANCSEVIMEQMPGFQSGVLCPQRELLEKFNISGNGYVTAFKTDNLGDNFAENEASKDMHSHGLNSFKSGRRLGRRSKKQRRSRKKILHGIRLQLSEDSGEIVNFETSTISTSDASKLNADSTLSKVNLSRASVNVLPKADLLPSLGSIVSEKVNIGSDTNRPSFSDRKMKETSLNILSSSLHLSDDVSTECPGHVGENTAKGPDCTSQLRTDEVTVHAGGSFLANENVGNGGDFGFQHDDSVELHVRKSGSILDLENKLLDSKDLLTSLGAVRVDSINEQPLQDGLVLFENTFDEVPFKCPTSVEVEDITGLLRHHENNIPKVQEDKHLSEDHKSCTASECEKSSCKEVENVVVYDMRSADPNSKEFFLDQVTIPEIGGSCSSNSKDARISEAAAVADCSNVSFGPFGPATSSNCLSADHRGILAEADISLVKSVNQSYKDGPKLSNKSCCIERISKSRNHLKTGLCIDNSSKIKRKRKRKARGTQMGISGSNAAVPIDKGSSVDELASLLATDISSVKDADFPVAEDNSAVKFRLKEGPSVDEDSHLDGVDFSEDGSFPGKIKKMKGVSPRLNLSSCLADDSIGYCLASDDLKFDQVSLRLAEQDADQREETPLTTHMASTDGSENFSILDVDGTLAYGNNNYHLKDDLAFIQNTLSVCADGGNDCAAQSGDELVASAFDTPYCMSSPEDLLSHTDFNSESEMIFEGFQTSNVKHVSRHSKTFSLRKSIKNGTSDQLQTNTKVPPSLPQKPGKVSSSKNKLTSAVPNIFSGHPAFNFHTSRKFPSHFAKSRTWHRTDHSSTNVAGPMLHPCPPPQCHAPKTPRISPSSYIRKGNSLVRKPSSSSITPAHTLSSSVYPSSPCIDYLKNNQVNVDAPCIPRIGLVDTSESQSLPLNHTERSLRSASCHLVDSLHVPNPLGSGGPAKTLDVLKETVKSFQIPECQTGSGNNSDSQSSTLGKENLGKKISYVKRRSNQLVATSDPEDSSTLGLNKSQASLSDGYYKNNKNQIIRVASESHARKGDSTANLNLHRLGSQTILPMRFGKRQSAKGFAKTYKLSKFPLVWNLNRTQLPDKSSNSLGPRKVWPYLFPWKRATYRRSSLPTISQKLMLSSKRGAIYTRSTHGYSLRMSKVLSACGRNLKWSKSIERNSKKANEEATRAVAAAEKRKKEEKGVISILSKSRNHVYRKSVVSVKLRPGERVFRIGSERYKMDPSRRTLHRITEEEPSQSVVLQSEKNLKRSYVPKRLLIGNDEYVRIGTGNQLVRDPKKRTRVLASEKVRWSLRTARLRLARKRKYCQFFTRFGKCNKSDGKCPYIHDPSKIAVCTKFLNDSCTDSDCKLTHEVLPERMQDCSYFLKGSCSSENCPYRHVNVNPESSICKRFLRGYCADGNECRKKHTYVCPDFESTGICRRSSICKLHHPKKKTEKKPVIEQKIVRGRYFDGGLIDVAECSMATGAKLSAKGEDTIVCEEGNFPDYISLDISYDGMEDA